MNEVLEVMNVKQAAEYLGRSPVSVSNAAREKKLPGYMLKGKWIFHKKALDRFLYKMSMQNIQSEERPVQQHHSSERRRLYEIGGGAK